jgi:hypothetical protein
MEANVAAAGPQFSTGECIQVDLACSHPQKLVGCVTKNLESLKRDYVFVFHDVFLSLFGFLKRARKKPGGRRQVTGKKAGSPLSGNGQHGIFERAAR